MYFIIQKTCGKTWEVLVQEGIVCMYMISANLEQNHFWADSHESLFDIEKLLKTVVLEK
jgi:hypothetical protein